MFVDVIGQNQHVRVCQQHLRQGLKLIPAVNCARRVGRRVEDQPAGLRCDRRGQCRGRQLESGIGIASDDSGFTTTQLHHLRITDPVRRRHDDFVTLIEGRGQGVVDHLLATVADKGVLPGNVQAVLTTELGGHRFSQ
ncbi:hypothetical protein D9M72_528710 [compost metagenome]